MPSITNVPPSVIDHADARPRSTTTSDRKSTRLNSSHLVISYAVFCLKKKIKARKTATYVRLVWLPMIHSSMLLFWEVFVFKQTTRDNFQILIDADTREAFVRYVRTY